MRTRGTSEGSVELLDLRVDVTDIERLVCAVMAWTKQRDRVRTAVGVNAHVCNLAAREPEFRWLVRDADLAYADGQSVVWASRLFGVHMPERVATTDALFPLCTSAAAAGKRVFFYGSAPGIAARAASRLRTLEPALQIAVSHGYVPEHEMDDLVRRINDFGTHILFVGLGDPLQQYWIARHRDQLQVPAVLTCGGLFDWTSGENRRPPQWMVTAGLEWLWRVLIEPRRLAKRYLLGNPAFVARVLRQYLLQRRGR